MKVECLKIDLKNFYYTPQNDKFEGYNQFPRPRTQPYYNQEQELRIAPEKREELAKLQGRMKLIEKEHNQTLYSYGNLKSSNLGTSYLTGTVNSQEEVKKTGRIKVF